MKRLEKILENLIQVSKKLRQWRTFVYCLAAIVVFTTTYSLILPAITVEKSATENVGGLVMEEADPGSTGAEAEAPGGVMTADAENETPDETLQEEVPDASSQTPSSENDSSENGTTQPASSQTETAQTAESTAAVDEEVKEPVNGEVRTIDDRRIMTLRGEDFDVVVSGDLSVGVSDGTVLSVRGISDADVVRSFSDRITDELYKNFVDTKTTEVLYQLVFTDKDLVEYSPAGNFDVQFIFHNNTVSHTNEEVYAAIYDYLTDEMVLAEKNSDVYKTPVISLNEYGIITGITLKGLNFGEYSDIITLVAGPVNEGRQLAAEQAADSAATDSRNESSAESVESGSKNENGTESAESDSRTESGTESAESGSKTESGTESAKSETVKTESADTKTDSADSKSDGPSAKAETSKESKKAGNGTLTARGSDYTVTLAYSAEAEIPANAVLEVTEIENGTAAYKKYLEQAKAAMGLDKDQVLPKEQARFFDIRIMADGKEVQPAANVSVNITYDQPVAEADPGTEAQIDASAVHFGKEGAEVVEVSDADASGVEFEAESFSVYGVIYTVDFEYTDPTTGGTYYYSLNGGESIYLTDLLVVLGIKGGDEVGKFVAEEVENVEFSDPELVKVTHKDRILGIFGSEDWLLLSLKPFDTDETLTVSLKNGEKIEVKVTDEQHSDISSLLSSVIISGAAQDSEGNYIVFPGEEYRVQLRFDETPTETFDKTDFLTYQLPMGVTFPEATSGTIVPPDKDLANIYSVNYTTTEDGLITFTWVIKPGQEEEFANLPGLYIGLNIDALFDEGQSQIDWGGKAQITVDQTHDVGVNKKSHLGGDGYMYYTVEVTSTGENRNISLTDTISGSALTLDQNSIAGDHGAVFSDKTDKGFSILIPELRNGETAKITYRAKVDYDVLASEAGVEKGKYGTVATTGNQIRINGSDDNPGNDESETHYDHNLEFSGVSKSVANGSFNEATNTRTLDWQIRANENHLTTISYIHDVMGKGKEKMTYSGEGITVRVVNPDWTTAASFTVPWEQLGVDSTSKEWIYNIPSEYKNKNYSFVIDYSTEVDVSEDILPVDISNDVDTDYSEGSGSGKADPSPGSKLDMEKTVVETDVPGGKVTWAITVDVPAGGLDSCVVTDILPAIHGELGSYTDGFDPSSFDTARNISGLIDGESVSVDTSQTGRVIFTFFKDGESGLYPVEGGRKVIITLTTTLNEDWIALKTDRDDLRYYNTHTNHAQVVANGYTIEKSASVTVNGTEPELIKKADAHFADSFHWKNWDEGNNLEAWLYRLYLYGISDDSFKDGYLEISDTFDDQYLKYYDPTDQNVFTNNGEIQRFHQKLTSGSEIGNYLNPVDIEAIVEGGTITFRIPQSAFKNSSGGYDRYYHVSYFLHVKDKDTIQKMNEDAIKAGGTLKLRNTAIWDYSAPSDVEVDYEVPIISKDYTATPEEKEQGIYHFEIKVNEDGNQLGDSDYLEVTDSYTNLTIDYATLECDPEDALLSYNHAGNTVTYYIKNGVPVTLRYTASALNDGEFSNTVEVNGQSVTKTGTAKITSRGTTGARQAKIKILKHSGSNLLEGIGGVKFELYLYDESFPNHYDPENKVLDGIYTTGEDGMFTINNIPLLASGGVYTDSTAKYVLHEAAPPEGYKVLPHDYEFTVDIKTANYGKYIYLNDDTLPISNEPEEEDEVSISVKKLWPDGDADLPEVIRVHLYQKDSKTAPDSSAREVDLVEMTRGEDGTWSHTFTGLHSGKAYFVKEDPVPGYTATYSSNNILGLEQSGEVTITNKKNQPEESTVSVIVQKKWMQGEQEITDISQKENLTADVELVRYRSELEGTRLHFINANSNVDTASILLPRNKQNITVNIDSIEGGNWVTYSTSYDPATPPSQLENDSSISKSGYLNKDTTSIVINTPDVSDIYAVSSYTPLISSLTVSTSAAFEGGEGADIDPTYTDPETITLKRTNGWRASFSDLPTTGTGSDDGKFYVYSYGIREVSTSDSSFALEAYSVPIYTGEGADNATVPIASGSTVTVTNKFETTSFEFSKEWHDASDQPETTWKDDVAIKVKVQRRIGTGGDPEDVGSYEIKNTGNGFAITRSPGAPVLSNKEGTFTFKISDLPKNGESGEYTYFAIEYEPVPGYREPQYSNIGALNNTDVAFNKGTIINRPVESYELPESGGFGNTLIYTMGVLLIAFATGMHTYLNRKKLIVNR